MAYDDFAARQRRSSRTAKGAATARAHKYLGLLLQCVGGNPADRRPLHPADIQAARVAYDELKVFLEAE
jgi:hypothetical protein